MEHLHFVFMNDVMRGVSQAKQNSIQNVDGRMTGLQPDDTASPAIAIELIHIALFIIGFTSHQKMMFTFKCYV